MEDFGWIIGIILVIALWPVFGAAAIVALIVWIYRVYKKNKQERIAREQREAQAREREQQRQKAEIVSQIRMRLSQEQLDIRGLQSYIASVDPAYTSFANKELESHFDEINKEVISQCAKGDFNRAADAADLLCSLHPTDSKLKKQKTSLQNMAGIASTARCFVMSEQYGVPNNVLIQNMNKQDAEQFKCSMQTTGPIYSLWYYAMQQPFDAFAFSVALSASKSIKANYYRVLIDPILACMYVAKYHPNLDIKALYPDYLQDAYGYIQTIHDRRQLQSFASALSWIGEHDLEQTCQTKLKRIAA